MSPLRDPKVKGAEPSPDLPALLLGADSYELSPTRDSLGLRMSPG